MNSESMSKRVGAVPIFPVIGPKLQVPELPVCEVESITCGASKIADAPGVKALGQHGAKVSDSLVDSS